MPTRCNSRATSCSSGTQTPVQTARQAAAEDEPMRIYSNPIPTAATAETEADNAALGKILEQLSCQSQLLVDLLAAVNAMTAATLSLNHRG